MKAPMQLYPITYSCYYGVFEGYDTTINYLDPSYIAGNILYNSGNMMVSIKDIVVYAADLPYAGAKTVS
jgi:hypothetical protein